MLGRVYDGGKQRQALFEEVCEEGKSKARNGRQTFTYLLVAEAGHPHDVPVLKEMAYLPTIPQSDGPRPWRGEQRRSQCAGNRTVCLASKAHRRTTSHRKKKPRGKRKLVRSENLISEMEKRAITCSS